VVFAGAELDRGQHREWWEQETETNRRTTAHGEFSTRPAFWTRSALSLPIRPPQMPRLPDAPLAATNGADQR
jgi:hypothetical protein